MATTLTSIMEDPQSQSEHEEEMSLEQHFSQRGCTDGPRRSHHPAFGQAGGGSVFPTHRLVVLSLGLLNALLLIAAVVIGIYCAKAKDLPISNSAATPLLVEVNFLSNATEIIRAKLEARASLEKERINHQQVKRQVKQTKIVIDGLQRWIETLQAEKTDLMTNKTSLEESCGRCLPGWTFLKSTCIYFSPRASDSKKNWPDSRADCIRRGADLLVIKNLEEMLFVHEKSPIYAPAVIDSEFWTNGYWIGLTDAAKPGTWVWVNNVTDSQTWYWTDGQPDYKTSWSQNCAASYHYTNSYERTVYNKNCHDNQMYWICEMQLVS